MKPIIYEMVTYLLHYIKCSGSNLTYRLLSQTEKPSLGPKLHHIRAFSITQNFLGSLDLGSFASLVLETVDELFLWGIRLFRACDVHVATTLAPKDQTGYLDAPFGYPENLVNIDLANPFALHAMTHPCLLWHNRVQGKRPS